MIIALVIALLTGVKLSWQAECECGKQSVRVNTRIVGGQEITPNSYPWMVGLATRSEENKILVFCGATLINNQYVVTAAHCFRKPKPFQLLLGGHDLDQDDVLVEAQEPLVHEYWNPLSGFNDIALIKLKEPITFTDKIKPICLTKYNQTNFDNLIAAGWGDLNDDEDQTRKLMHVQLQMNSGQQCRLRYGPRFNNKHICASGPNKGVCSGDSGGPLMAVEGDTTYLAGLTSWGMRGHCGDSSYPAVFTRISEYRNWIIRNTKDATYCEKN